jgi:hypothetical protein
VTHLLEQVSALYRDPLEVDEEAGDLPVPSREQLEISLLIALRDGDDDFAALLAGELRRIHAATTEALLIGNRAGLWRMH